MPSLHDVQGDFEGFRGLTDEDYSWLVQFEAERAEERELLQLKYPPCYEPAAIAEDEEFTLDAEDLAYWAGHGVGLGGDFGTPPAEMTAEERLTWHQGWLEGHNTYLKIIAFEFQLSRPDLYGECRLPLAGHDAESRP